MSQVIIDPLIEWVLGELRLLEDGESVFFFLIRVVARNA